MTEAQVATHGVAPSARIGMWLFLLTEIILFGGLFLLYSAYRSRYPHEFHDSGQELNYIIGTVNTMILLTSSLTLALSIASIQRGDKRRAQILLALTLVLGAAFLLNKYFEWAAKIHHGVYPNGPELLGRPPGAQIFYGLYFSMTGLHGIHVVAGIVLLAIMLALLSKDRIRMGDSVTIENAGLYWHLVDVIWIFLLPLFYLAA